jgi:hypothetical protein
MLITIVVAVFASAGFWSFINRLMQNKGEKSPERQMLLGLAHDRICYLAEKYIERGWITRDEYENLHDYLYLPYKRLGGNGTADRLMEEVDRLPIRQKDGDLQ